LIDLDDPIIKGYLTNLIGEEGIKVVKNMPEGEVTDEEIAKATGVLLNIVRRTLFILYENRLATYRRERDTDSGWLTYLWKLDMRNIDRLLDTEVKKLLKNLKTRLEFEENNVFYTCDKGCGRYLFDMAAESGFICPVCGGELTFQDNEEIVKALRKRIAELEAVASRGYG